MKNTFYLLTFLTLSLRTEAAIVKKDIEYKDGKTVLQGYIAYDDTLSSVRPGVLVVHNWLGLTEHTKEEADRLAAQGYVAFAADIYGKGVRPQGEEAGRTSGLYKNDRKLFRSRLNAALKELEKQKNVDRKSLAAIGFCFGGTGVIELARSGANLKGVVSFHGSLDSPTPADGKKIKAKVLALHGAIDPFVKADDLAAFEAEMNQHKVDYQLVKYGGAVHSFTEKAAGLDISKGAAYNADADKRSRQAMQNLFDEIL